jgi:hypothetical protein
MAEFDFDATFGDDYLHFYLPALTPERTLRPFDVPASR